MGGNREEPQGWTHASDPQSLGQSIHKGNLFQTNTWGGLSRGKLLKSGMEWSYRLPH